MPDPYIGEIRMFGGNYAPVNWAPCDGRMLSITENTALYSVLGTTYGGDGYTTFGLPDLRGRVPLSAGDGPQTSNHPIGSMGGTESVALTPNQMPNHNHTLAVGGRSSSTSPKDNYLANSAGNSYDGTAGSNHLATDAISKVGEGQPHTNMQPYTTLNFIIALSGSYPSRS